MENLPPFYLCSGSYSQSLQLQEGPFHIENGPRQPDAEQEVMVDEDIWLIFFLINLKIAAISANYEASITLSYVFGTQKVCSNWKVGWC